MRPQTWSEWHSCCAPFDLGVAPVIRAMTSQTLGESASQSKVVIRERVALGAMSSPWTDRETAPGILSRRNGFEVIWIDAAFIQAQVIGDQFTIERTNEERVRDAGGTARFPAYRDAPVAFRSTRASPFPTPSVFVESYLGEKTLLDGIG
jgi:hypothetical protein